MAEQKFEVVYRREETFVADVKCPKCGSHLQHVQPVQDKFAHVCKGCGLHATLSQPFPKRVVKAYPNHPVTDRT